MKVRPRDLSMEVQRRFWAKVRKTPTCWIWTGARSPGGYGHFTMADRRQIGAHRYAWLISHPLRDISRSNFVCHRCDNRRCVLPSHLFLGTARENLRDASKKGRMCRGESHHMAKLTRQDALAIRCARAAGMTRRDLARSFSVDPNTITQIVDGRTWKHVGGPINVR